MTTQYIIIDLLPQPNGGEEPAVFTDRKEMHSFALELLGDDLIKFKAIEIENGTVRDVTNEAIEAAATAYFDYHGYVADEVPEWAEDTFAASAAESEADDDSRYGNYNQQVISTYRAGR